MKPKVVETGRGEFWIYNPMGGRGRHCRANRAGELEDNEDGMFYERSPECYQEAYRQYRKDKP